MSNQIPPGIIAFISPNGSIVHIHDQRIPCNYNDWVRNYEEYKVHTIEASNAQWSLGEEVINHAGKSGSKFRIAEFKYKHDKWFAYTNEESTAGFGVEQWLSKIPYEAGSREGQAKEMKKILESINKPKEYNMPLEQKTRITAATEELRNYHKIMKEQSLRIQELKDESKKLSHALTWALPFAHGSKTLAIEDLQEFNAAKELVTLKDALTVSIAQRETERLIQQISNKWYEAYETDLDDKLKNSYDAIYFALKEYSLATEDKWIPYVKGCLDETYDEVSDTFILRIVASSNVISVSTGHLFHGEWHWQSGNKKISKDYRVTHYKHLPKSTV